MNLPSGVRIREVGPRDGIQSERAEIATADKIRLVDALGASGLKLIEVASFVSPRAVPQMADALEVWEGIRKRDGVFFSALVPTARYAETAAAAGVHGLQVFIAATDSYNLSNVRKTVEDSLSDVRAVAEVGDRAGIPVEGTISTAFGCPYEGDVDPGRVASLAARIGEMGVRAISFGDTTGMATPRRVAEVVDAVRSRTSDLDLNMHFHDTRGTGLANVVAALDLGVDYFDSSIGGMGGSPFAAGATGNVATEDLVHMLDDMGVETGIDLGLLLHAARLAQTLVPGDLPGKILKAGPRTQVEGPIAPPG